MHLNQHIFNPNYFQIPLNHAYAAKVRFIMLIFSLKWSRFHPHVINLTQSLADGEIDRLENMSPTH